MTISELINSVASKTTLAKNDVLFALELALEQAVCEYFGTKDCQVYIQNKLVIPVFQVPFNLEIEEAELFSPQATYNDLISPEFDFKMLHKDIVERCKKLFLKYLVKIESDELFKRWKNKIHQVVSGVIEKTYHDKIEIRLDGNAMGVMPKAEWTPRERAIYQKETVLKFFVSKAMRYKSGTFVFLSRGSKNFPAALLKEKMPWIEIKVLKRIRGRKTWLKTNAAIHKDVINEVTIELKGEILEIEF